MNSSFKQFISIVVLFLIGINIAFAKTYGSTLCQNPEFACYVAKRGDTWRKLFTVHEQNLLMRLNRVNISLYPGMRIAIPRNMHNLDTMSISPFSHQINPTGEKLIIVSLSKLAWGAYNSSGELENWGPVSGGQEWCHDIKRGCRTVTGVFKIYRKQGSGCISTKFPIPRGGAPMPYCMFFHGGYALHGSWLPGYNASHGCIRLFTDDARWLNQEFLATGLGVTVIIRR